MCERCGTPSNGLDRRRFLGMAGASVAAAAVVPLAQSQQPAAAPAPPFELEEATFQQLREAMESGRLSSVAITQAYLNRIAAIDQPLALRAMIELNPDALAIAKQRDDERRQGRVRGPLHGIPIAIKDNIETADRMRTSAGSLALAESSASRDAFIVGRLRESGAVLLGKTNLSEWANFRSTRSTSGWSGRGGQTRNPYVLDRNPCGSSSGSGVAPAANLVAAAIGTETDGSIVCPSTANGLVGIKPTLGLLSRSGIVPLAHSQDTAGPMARTVTDAALLLAALRGIDTLDPVTYESRRHLQVDYAASLDPKALAGARIGVARQYFGFNQHVDRVMDEAIDVLRRLGAELVDPVEIATKGEFDQSEFEVLLYEFKADLNAYLAQLPPSVPYRTLADLIRFNEENAAREMPFFGQEIFVMAEGKGPLTTKAYRDALAKNHRLSRTRGIDATMAKHRLDAMIAPTGGAAWPIDLINGDHYTGGYSSASAVSGYPHVTVPAGLVFGLPVGISFFGSAWSEAKLIGYAYAFEQETKARRAPRFLQTVHYAEG